MKRRADVPRDHVTRPYVIPFGSDKCVAMSRTSKYAQTLEDSWALAEWQQHYALLGLHENQWLHSKINAVPIDPEKGERDWTEMVKLTATARRLAGADEASEYGTLIHKVSEKLDRGEPLGELAPEVGADLMAYQYGMEPFQHKYIEEFLVCEEIGVAGTADRLSLYEGLDPDGIKIEPDIGGLIVVDIKTGKLKGQSWGMQLAMYAHGQPYGCLHTVKGKPSREQCEENVGDHEYGQLNINQYWGLVVHVPRETGTVGLYWVDLQQGWEDVQLARAVRASRSAKIERLREFQYDN